MAHAGGTTSDANGFYNLSDVPAGTYYPMSTYIGYDSARALKSK